MILIADAGSTKTRWCVLNGAEKVADFVSSGINPSTMPTVEIENIISDVLLNGLANCKTDEVENVYYFGAGCKGDVAIGVIKSCLSKVFVRADIVVDSDMTGAAISLFGPNEGIACILGTGSNSSLWNGKKIIENIPSLGFILGDEGSGSHIGKALLHDFFKCDMPGDIKTLFHQKYDLSLETVIERVYRRPAPAAYLASFAPFVSENISHRYCRDLAIECFLEFFRRNVLKYSDAVKLPIAFIGSIACNFSEPLKEAASRCKLKIVKIAPSPMAGLVEIFGKTRPDRQ